MIRKTSFQDTLTIINNPEAVEINHVVTNDKPLYYSSQYALDTDYIQRLVESYMLAYNTPEGTYKGGNLRPDFITSTTMLGFNYENNVNSDNFSNAVFSVPIWQTKYTFLNPGNNTVFIELYDYVARENSPEDPWNLFQNFMQHKETDDAVLDNINYVAPGTGRSSSLAAQTYKQFDNIDPQDGIILPKEAAFYIKRFWKQLKHTTIKLQPGGSFTYVQTMKNIRIKEYMYKYWLDKAISAPRGFTRCLFTTMMGQTAFDDSNNVQGPSDFHVNIKREEHWTCFGPMHLRKPMIKGQGVYKGYPTLISTANQEVFNDTEQGANNVGDLT
jgi:hypothetical protein